jgi:tRNA-2-methylthio-N6-dimethylallyladenosine synthase
MPIKKYHIITYGCQANWADSERIAGKLESAGYKKTSKPENADIVVINSCSVRQSAINRLYSKIKKFGDKQIVIAGCVLEDDKKKLKSMVKEIWHPDDYFDLLPIYSDLQSAFVPIMTGCNNFCSYCAVPYTRNRERSRKEREIIQEIKNLIKRGYKEIWLLGQNVNSFKPSFPKLLRQINSVPGSFTIRFMSSHPKDFSGELIKTIARCPKISKEIHLAVQSGDNKILKAMNRHYTVGNFKKLIRNIIKLIPEVKISTDAIVGFPSETKKQFENTVKLFKEIKFYKAYISRYSPRPGTMAAKLKDNIPQQEKKRRWKILNDIANSKK